MNKAEANAIVKRSEEIGDRPYFDLAAFAADELHRDAGCYLTLDAAAALVRYQAKYIGEGWDEVERSNMLHWMRRAVIVDAAQYLPDPIAKRRAEELEKQYQVPVATFGGRFANVEIV